MGDFWVLLIFVALITALIGAWIGSRVDQRGTGFWLGLLLGPIGWIIVLLLPRETGTPSQSPTVTSTHHRSRAATKWADLQDSTDAIELSAFVEAFPGTNEAFEAAKHKQLLVSWRAADKEDVRVLTEFYQKDNLDWLKPEIWGAIKDGASRHPDIDELKVKIEDEEARQRIYEAERRRIEAENERVIAEEAAQRQQANSMKFKKNAKIITWVLISAGVAGGAFYVVDQYQRYKSLPVHELRNEAAVCERHAQELEELLAQRNAMSPSPEREVSAARVEDLQYDVLPECRREVRQRQRDLDVSDLKEPRNFFDYLFS